MTMRKILAIFCALVLLSTAGVTAAAVSVNSARAKVTLTENVLWGEPAAAEGAVIRYTAHHDHFLFWDITFRAGTAPITEAVYDFSAVQKPETRRFEPFRGVSLETIIEYGMDFTEPEEELTGISRVYRELYDRLQPGEELSETVRLADYYEYYPIGGLLSLGSFDLSWSEVDMEIRSEDWQLPLSAFSDFFRIPMLENEIMEIHVSKSNGGGLSWGASTARTTPESSNTDSYSMTTNSALTADACYITINNRTQEGELIDTSEIPGGYGIYCLPIGTAEDENVPDIEGLYVCYPLDEEVIVTALYADASGTRLHLFTQEGEAQFLTVIDIASMEAIQRLEYTDPSAGELYSVFREEGYTVLRMSRNRLILLEENADGTFACRLDTELYPDSENRPYTLYDSAALAWNGERLLVVDFLNNHYVDTTNFTVAVYAAEGMQYCGEYKCSLDTGMAQRSDYYCRPLDHEPLQVEWE